MSNLKNHSQLHREKNKGAAMIVVVCVMAIVMILSLTLVMAAYQMLATVSDEGRDELYYQQAMSFSEVLRNGLTQRAEDGTSSDALIQHIDSFMFNDNSDAATKETLNGTHDGSTGVYGDIVLVLDKDTSKGNLLITISVYEDDIVMAKCISKYIVEKVSEKPEYTFDGYYNNYNQEGSESD